MRKQESKSLIHLPKGKGLGLFVHDEYRVVRDAGEGVWRQEKGEVMSALCRHI